MMFTIGTAGHIDHGKSALVEALTGMDPDRLPEEKARGMTIDLGFAWLPLPSGREISIVDVPGHERFIRNMVAGVGSIDATLFIVAGDEGVMPQTREHLAILNLLGIEHGLIVITKSDLVEQDWIELVAAEVLELVDGTCLDGAPIVTVSATKKTGLESLVAELDTLLDGVRPHEAGGNPRLSIDRAFTVGGFGTVVTGTLIGGSLTKGREMEVLPIGRRSRIRGIQSHKSSMDDLVPGSRAAVNLSGVEVAHVPRGSVLAVPGDLRPARLVDVRLSMLPSIGKPLKNGTEVAIHSGTADVRAAVRLLDHDVLDAGETAWAQLRLRKPLSVKQGDRFIARQLSPAVTIGGGEIVSPKASRLKRHDIGVLDDLERLAAGDPLDAVVLALERAGPLRKRELAGESAALGGEFDSALKGAIANGQVVLLGSTYVETAGLGRLSEAVQSLLEDFHKANPLRAGLGREELRSRLGLDSGPFNDLMAHFENKGVVRIDDAVIMLAAHNVELSEQQERVVSRLLGALKGRGIDVPPLKELAGRFSVTDELLDSLEASGRLVRVSANIGYESGSFDELKVEVVGIIRENGEIDVSTLRDHFGSSRKFCLPLLEHLDSMGITRRVGDHRVLRR